MVFVNSILNPNLGKELSYDPEAVWPDFDIKSSPNFPKNHKQPQFLLKNLCFQNSPRIIRYLGFFCKKIPQSDHTVHGSPDQGNKTLQILSADSTRPSPVALPPLTAFLSTKSLQPGSSKMLQNISSFNLAFTPSMYAWFEKTFWISVMMALQDAASVTDIGQRVGLALQTSFGVSCVMIL